jgi:cytochrome c peroxidase
VNAAFVLRSLACTALWCCVFSTSARAATVAPQAAQRPAAIDSARLPAELSSLTPEEVGRIARMSPVASFPGDPTNRFADDERAAELGQFLFFDARVSPKAVSCATCHDPKKHFTDGLPLARGVGVTTRNAPTVVDAGRRRWNGWDGKFDSLWSQALAPIENPVEMGGDRATFVRVVRDDATLRARYEAIFGPWPTELEARDGRDPLASPARPASNDNPEPAAKRWAELSPAARTAIDQTTAHLLKSLGAYQRTLRSGPAPVDRFVSALRGDPTGDLEALDASARRGLAIFVAKGGCFQCHRGANFTDEEFHALGLVGANGRVPDDPARLAAVDFVQSNPFNAAGEFSDSPDSPKGQMVSNLKRAPELFGQFRTPPLRGVALTPPFMHDGRLATLADVVRFYDTLEGAAPIGHHGESVLVPLGLGDSGRADLEAFLRALTGAPPDERWARNPHVPGSSGQPEASGLRKDPASGP